LLKRRLEINKHFHKYGIAQTGGDHPVTVIPTPVGRRFMGRRHLAQPVSYPRLWILACVCFTYSGYGAPADEHFSEVQWPLGRSGEHRVLLALPNGDASESTFNGQVHEELLLTALWPGLIFENAANHEEFNRPGGGRLMMAHVQSAAIEEFAQHHYDALQSEFDIAIKSSIEMMCTGVMAQSKCFKRDGADEKPSKYGLNRLGIDFAKYPDFPERDRSGQPERDVYYLRSPNGDLSTVILCMAEEAKTVEDGPQYMMVPHCEQKFVFKPMNVLVSVAYRRVYLPEWKAIQADWGQLLQSFIVRTLPPPDSRKQ
jgi:hypothetical protein